MFFVGDNISEVGLGHLGQGYLVLGANHYREFLTQVLLETRL